MNKKDLKGFGLIEYRIECIMAGKRRLKAEIGNTRPIEQRNRRAISKRIDNLRDDHENLCRKLFKNIADSKKNNTWETDIEHSL